MTTIIILAVLLVGTWIVFGLAITDLLHNVRDHDSWIRKTCGRVTGLEADLAESKNRGAATARYLRSEIEALATVVAANADRTTRLEGEDAPRRPACPATYIATTYPKRADEI